LHIFSTSNSVAFVDGEEYFLSQGEGYPSYATADEIRPLAFKTLIRKRKILKIKS